MKHFQQNLLILLACGLCLLCTWQWYRQTRQRMQIQDLSRLVYEKSVAVRDATNSIATLNHQIAQMDSRLTELRETARTNAEVIVSLKRRRDGLETANEGLTNEIAQYQQAVDAMTTKLKAAYDGINKQNAALQELVAQRDEFVKKYNDSVQERNGIVAKYNELAARVKKMQSGQSE
jgi:chromosome segregation ATPase